MEGGGRVTEQVWGGQLTCWDYKQSLFLELTAFRLDPQIALVRPNNAPRLLLIRDTLIGSLSLQPSVLLPRGP